MEQGRVGIKKNITYGFYLRDIKTNTSAVYVLYEGQTALYVGKSTNLRIRLLEHLRQDVKGFAKRITHIEYYPESHSRAMTYLEDSLIHRLNPSYNKLEAYKPERISSYCIYREIE